MRGHSGKSRYPDKGGAGRRKGPPVLFFFILMTVSAAIIVMIARKPSGSALPIPSSQTGARVETSESSPSLFPVHVDGAVKRPGLYYFREGAILNDAILEAGGLTGLADRRAVNLAVRLQPHLKVYIPRQGEEVDDVIDETGAGGDGKIDLNRASREELEQLPGIGRVTAEAIIAYREAHGPFQVIEDLMRVAGIKEGRFASLKDSVKVTNP